MRNLRVITVGCKVCWLVAVLLLLSVVSATAKEDRWQNFAEDADQKYFLDRKSIINTPESTTTFWVKSVAKSKEYYTKEYNLNDLAYILTNYELDCVRGVFRVKENLLLTKNRKELSRTLPEADVMPDFEPVRPESVTELAMETVCEVEKDEPEVQSKPPAPTLNPGLQ